MLTLTAILHCNVVPILGNAFKDAGKVEDAIACYSTAINLEPNYAEAYANLAAVHKDCGRVLESIQLYRKALELRPDFVEAIANLTHCLVSAREIEWPVQRALWCQQGCECAFKSSLYLAGRS